MNGSPIYFSELFGCTPWKPLAELPPEATYAAIEYRSNHQFAPMPEKQDALQVFATAPAKWIEVPLRTFASALMGLMKEYSDDWMPGLTSFEEYHAWYLTEEDALLQYPLASRWPCIASQETSTLIEDGWHRMHSYVRSGHKTIPILHCFTRDWFLLEEAWQRENGLLEIVG